MEEQHEEHHFVAWRVYAYNFTALSALMALTVWAAFIEMGALNLPVALAIAVAKTACIVLIFMNVKYYGHLVWIFAGVGFFLVPDYDCLHDLGLHADAGGVRDPVYVALAGDAALRGVIAGSPGFWRLSAGSEVRPL